MRAPPPGVLRGVEAALAEAGRAARVTGARPIGGGCVSDAARVDTDRGDRWFVKWNAAAPAGLFEAEANGLAALREAGAGTALRVPSAVASGGGGDDPAWILMEWLEASVPQSARDYGVSLGCGLAQLHEGSDSAGHGWPLDNFIGTLPQANAPAATWGAFWRDRRLAPQLRAARCAGHFAGTSGDVLERVLERTAALLAGVDADAGSLLHGDLWGGNVLAAADGRPALIDPAVYRGHGEVDLAMSELFGGFPAGFLDAYREKRPLGPDYARVRRPLYQLYYLLVHVNLFGSGYVSGTLGAARAVLAAT